MEIRLAGRMADFSRVLLLLVLVFQACSSYPRRLKFPIGSIFDKNKMETFTAFRLAVDRINGQKWTFNLKRPKTPQIIDTYDQYNQSYSICNQMGEGSIAIFGVQNVYSADMITDYCTTFHMPFINIGISESYRKSGPFQIHMQPRYEKALVDFMQQNKWTKIIYVYNCHEGMVRLYHIIEEINRRNILIRMTFMYVNSVGEARRNFDELDIKKPMEMKHVVVDMNLEDTVELLKRQNTEAAAFSLKYHFLIARLHINEFLTEKFPYGGMNISGFIITNFTNATTKSFIERWKVLDPQEWPGAGKHMFSYEAAFATDAVNIFVQALSKLRKQRDDIFRNRKFFYRGEVYNNGTSKMFCEPRPDQVAIKPWALGKMIAEAIKQEETDALTGHVAFNDEGYRRGYRLGLIGTTTDDRPSKFGYWVPAIPATERSSMKDRCNKTDTPDCRLRLLKNPQVMMMVNGSAHKTPTNETLIVTSILNSPYIMLNKKPKPGGGNWTGNQRYIGFCADLVELIAKGLNKSYEIVLVKDGKWGDNNNRNKTWNGMVGQLIRREADLCVADLTITAARERVIDFSKPFMTTGVSIMLKIPERNAPNVFSFMDPISMNIWLCVSFAYIGVSVVLFLVSRFSPSEWHYEDMDDGPHITNDFSIINSLWFAIGAFMQQGCEVAPRSLSGRIVGSIWWFFTLILISSYTANLAAFLTVSRMKTPITSADDLSKQTDIQYGSIGSGTSKTFFRESKISTYERMWAYMSSAEDVFVKSSAEGVKRVRKGNYAFLVESTTNDYINNRYPCNTMKVGHNLNSKGFGVGMPKGYQYKNDVTLKVLELIEKGEVHRLQTYWWKEDTSQGTLCKKDTDTKDLHSSQALSIDKIAGVFFILIGGMGGAVILSIVEMFYKSIADSRKKKTPFMHELKKKIKLSLRGKISNDRDEPDGRVPVKKSVSTYTYSAPSSQLITLDGYSDHGNHTQV